MNSIPTLNVSELHRHLGFALACSLPVSMLEKSLTDWRMETDDDLILRYLFRQFQPRRHLEFGTWEGAGVLRVLESCAATVWTINLYEGESGGDGMWKYYVSKPGEDSPIPGSATRVSPKGNLLLQTDSGVQIGRKYLQAGLGHRVCQIYCDSTQWDTSAYPAGFFDSVLIDGGHTRDICLADTRKALPLLKSGGMCLWHDYCPVKEVMERCDSVPGVVAAIDAMKDELQAQMRELFWIKPSWLLVGIKR